MGSQFHYGVGFIEPIHNFVYENVYKPHRIKSNIILALGVLRDNEEKLSR